MENSIPIEIILVILSFLPAELVLRCKVVCKTWRNLIGGTYFAHMHLRRQQRLLHYYDSSFYGGLNSLVHVQFVDKDNKEIEFYYGQYVKNSIDDKLYRYKIVAKIINQIPPLGMEKSRILVKVGSCNGLICFALLYSHDPAYICNPITGEYVYLPRFRYSSVVYMVNGFGYHPSSDEYKVVRIYYKHIHAAGQVQVYTLGSGNGWRNKGEIKYNLKSSPAQGGILANGALHWLSRDDSDERTIVAFNLVNEKFRVITPPPCFLVVGDVAEKHSFELWELGGCLCVVHQVKHKRVDIWSLKKTKNYSSYNTKDDEKYQTGTWSREFSIPCQFIQQYDTYALTESGEVLLWGNGTIPSCYDPETETFRRQFVNVFDPSWEFSRAIHHINSFVSLNALGEKVE